MSGEDATTKLDEVALRREGFHEGVRVVLGDGQEWALPDYRFKFFPRRGAGGGSVATGRITYGPERDRDLGMAFGEEESAPGERLDALLRLAADLFLANYDLTDAMLETLLSYDGRDEGSREMWEGIVAAIQGRGAPKPSPAGSA